jgi:PhoPQ-activated pathogenicity-related protein
MSLSRQEVNPLGVLDLRKLKFIPKHFTKISVDESVDIKLLDLWISYNLNSRYAIKRRYSLDLDNRLTDVIEIGIEDPKETLMLTLGCPYIHTK